MSRRRHQGGKFSLRTFIPSRKSVARRSGTKCWTFRRFRLEHLEPRHLLTATVWETSLPWTDPYADEGGSGAAIEDLLQPAPFPLDQTFMLHSNPGSQFVLYLDFNGHNTTGTPWNDDSGIGNISSPPYSIDASLAFSDAEREAIQFIWERVAEDFRPFDIDVTTEDPGAAAMAQPGYQRIVIGGAGTDWYDEDGGVGGVARGSFNANGDIPAFAFSISVGNGEKNVAEVISHEAGHTLGLGHDGESGDPEVDYYAGHGAGPTGWAPIMGVGYGQNLTQWSIGEYPNANNQQDDLTIITTMNGFGYRPDDHGNDIATATELEFDKFNFYGEGIIEQNTDVDYFAFDLGVEILTININPFHRGPNLDVLAKLYNAAGEELIEMNLEEELSATILINADVEDALQLPIGQYYLSVEGTGKPPGMDVGYSDYGSLGYYSVIAERESLLDDLIGIDFDVFNGMRPLNWNRYSGGGKNAVMVDLMNELGVVTPVNLAITTSKSFVPIATSTADPTTIPIHPEPLTELGGHINDTNVAWTFTFSDLVPITDYEIYVFGLSSLDAENHVEIVGFNSASFTQTLIPNELKLNADTGAEDSHLVSFAEIVTATENGRITLTVSNLEGRAGLAGLAIREATPGVISGMKWHDENGDGIMDEDEEGLEGWTIFIDDNNNGIWDDEIIIESASVDVPQIIPDFTPTVPVKSILLFQGLRTITDVDVHLNISHTFNTDLDVFLVSPSGTRVELFTDVGANSDNFHGTILDDEAVEIVLEDDEEVEVPKLISEGTGPFTGRYRPEGMLSDFDGEDPTGVWTLEIYDDAQFNPQGILNSWSLTITGQELFAVTDEEGNYSIRNIRPGNIVLAERLDDQFDWAQTFAPPPPIRVTSGARLLDNNFGNWIPDIFPGGISGQKWNDLNGDGVKDENEPGLEGWTVFLDVNGNGILDPPVTVTLSSEDLPVIEDPEDPDYEVNMYPKPIIDFGTTIGQLSFEGLTAVKKITVTLDISHTFAADVDVFLVSPSRTSVKLFGDIGGQDNDFINTTLDDDADTWIFDNEAPFTGTFRPEGLLSDFVGEDPNGIWQLIVRDTTFGDEGTLNSWSLTIHAEEQSTVTDAEGNYAFPILRPNFYFVHEVMQPGWEQSYPLLTEGIPFWPVELQSLGVIENRDFGNRFVGVEGDYNDDGIVNAADYVFWRDRMGAGGAGGGDGSGDGSVGPEDYDIWYGNFGVANPSGAGAGEAMAAATSANDSSSEPFVTSFSASGDSAGAAATLVGDGAGLRGFGSRGGAAQRPTNSAPDADRADSAMLAWLAGLGEEDGNDRFERQDRTRFDWDFAGDRDRSNRLDRFAAAIDSAFENLGV